LAFVFLGRRLKQTFLRKKVHLGDLDVPLSRQSTASTKKKRQDEGKKEK